MNQANTTPRGGLGRHGASPIRWAGSKRHIVNRLAPVIAQSGRRYFEPFAGSAALFFKAGPLQAKLGDLNTSLINFYQHLRETPQELHRVLSEIKRSEETYYEIREKFNAASDLNFENAVHFAYLNRNCFNGIWRTNRLGKFNVPYAKSGLSEYPTEQHFEFASELLKRAELLCSDFRVTLRDAATADSIIYADPPYFSGTERVFVEYGSESFGKKDVSELCKVLHDAANRGAIVIASYKSGEHFHANFEDWNHYSVPITRNVGGFVGSRKRAQEVIVSNVKLSGFSDLLI